MKEILAQLLQHHPLTTNQAQTALLSIGRGEVNGSQTAAFLTALAMRPITVDELEGFRSAMLELCLKVDLSEFDPMDVCGTGGDGKDTFNISTTAAFVVAGTGQTVAKNGNHGVSSSVGSSTVLEHLGVKFSNDFDHLRRKIETAGICYLHAPLFHPAMKYVAPIRKELGFKTFFNILGPLLNAAFIQKQLAGVYSANIAELYTGILQKSRTSFAVLQNLDGYDEISLTGACRVITKQGESVLFPEDFGFQAVTEKELYGGDTLEESAIILKNILQNQGTKAQTQVVLANAAVALCAADPTLSLADAVAKATESLESGRAYQSLKKLAE
ncbi:MAG: anthranilate phosphoribosyltransferase [Spirosomataceae bacterium]